MKLRICLFFALLITLLACSTKKSSQNASLHSYSVVKRSVGTASMLKGVVRGYDGLPALEAQVLSLGRGQGARVLTDESGYFEMNIASGELQLDITSVAYGNVRTKPLLVAPKEIVELDIVLGAEKGVHKARQENETFEKAGTFLGKVGDFFLRVIDFFTPRSIPS